MQAVALVQLAERHRAFLLGAFQRGGALLLDGVVRRHAVAERPCGAQQLIQLLLGRAQTLLQRGGERLAHRLGLVAHHLASHGMGTHPAPHPGVDGRRRFERARASAAQLIQSVPFTMTHRAHPFLLASFARRRLPRRLPADPRLKRAFRWRIRPPAEAIPATSSASPRLGLIQL